MAADLLPCPFCGGAAEIMEDAIGCVVACTECDTGTYNRHASLAKAVATWQRRAPPIAAPAPSAMATGEDPMAWVERVGGRRATDAELAEIGAPETGSLTLAEARTIVRAQADEIERRRTEAFIAANANATPPAAPAAVTEGAADRVFVAVERMMRAHGMPLNEHEHGVLAETIAAALAAAASAERGE